jgi:HlyD family secretion protein
VRVPWRRIVLIAVGLAVVGLIVYGFWPKPIEVDLAKATRGRLLVTVDHEGKTRVKQRYVVAAPLGGILQRVSWRPGDRVVAGQPFLAFDPGEAGLLNERELALAKRRVEQAGIGKKHAAAKLELAQTNHQLALDELARTRSLIAKKSASQHDLDTALHKEASATKEIVLAQWGIQIARWEEEIAQAALIHSRPPTSPGERGARRFELQSPVTGVVLRVFEESETPVTPGQKILELGDLREMECEIDVLSADAVKIPEKAKVFLEHWGGEAPLLGQVRRVEPYARTKISALGVEEQRAWVMVDFVDPPEKRPTLGDAYRVEARIVIWEGENVLKVPAGALFRREGAWAVFLAADDRAELCHVKVGKSNGLETEILDGLTENDQVILHPGDRIHPDVAIRARPNSLGK